LSVNPKKFKRNNRKLAEIREIRERLEAESDIVYLKSLKFELNSAIKHEKLQRRINERNSWKGYVC
jgi:hypothetical protein